MTDPEALAELERVLTTYPKQVAFMVDAADLRSLVADSRVLASLTAEVERLRARLNSSRLDHIGQLLDLLHPANPAAFREIRGWLDELREGRVAAIRTYPPLEEIPVEILDGEEGL